MSIIIVDTLDRFDPLKGETFRHKALQKARDSFFGSSSKCNIKLITDLGHIDELNECLSKSCKIVFVHQSDIEKYPVIDNALNLNKIHEYHVVKFTGAEEGASVSVNDYPERVFSINCSIKNEVFDKEDTWIEIFRFLQGEIDRPSVISSDLLPPIHSAALILLQGYQLISLGMGCIPMEGEGDAYNKIEKTIERAQITWANMSRQEKDEYWAPIANDTDFLEQFKIFEIVICHSKIGNVDEQMIAEAIDSISTDVGLR